MTRTFIGHPFFLVLAPRGAFHLAVIADGSHAVFLQEIDRVSHARDCRGGKTMMLPSDTCFTARSSHSFCVFCVTLANDVAQIGTAKAGDVFVRLAQAKLLDDVMANPLRGAGGERGDRTVGKKFTQSG